MQSLLKSTIGANPIKLVFLSFFFLVLSEVILQAINFFLYVTIAKAYQQNTAKSLLSKKKVLLDRLLVSLQSFYVIIKLPGTCYSVSFKLSCDSRFQHSLTACVAFSK